LLGLDSFSEGNFSADNSATLDDYYFRLSLSSGCEYIVGSIYPIFAGEWFSSFLEIYDCFSYISRTSSSLNGFAINPFFRCR